jgi:hypothetical protein
VVISDGVAVDKDAVGDYVEIHAQLDEILTSTLLARNLDAQGSVSFSFLLTD